MIISIVLFIFLWILPKHYNKIYIQRPQSQALKFIAALLVVSGHQTVFYCHNTSSLIKSETDLGSLCVAFFLFMSGYGLLYGYLNKGCKPPTFNWLIKHLFKLIIPALTATILYTITKIGFKQDIDWSCLFTWWFVSNANLLYGWYVTEIIILYLGFFICFHYIKPQLALKILCTIIALAMGIMIIVQAHVWYIKGLPCFIMGLILAKLDTKELKLKIKSTFIQFTMTLSVIIFYILKDFHRIQEIIPFLDRWRYTYLSSYLINIVFILIIINILMRLPLCNNKILNKGNYFYEIYLVQGASLLACRELIKNDIIFILIGMIVTIIIAKWMSVLNKYIIRKVTEIRYNILKNNTLENTGGGR